MKKYIFLILILLGVTLPMITFAALPNFNGPIVICGTKASGADCTLCDVFKMADNIINLIIGVIILVGPILIAVGGIMILFAGADPGLVAKGKSVIKNVIIGLIIALLAWTAINMIFNELTTSYGTKGAMPWNKIECTGGGISDSGYGYQDSSFKCHSSQCNGCVACTSSCVDGTDCASGGDGSPNPYINNKICCCDLESGLYSCNPYSSNVACNTECPNYCSSIQGNASRNCCVAANKKCGEDGAENICDKRSAPGSCFGSYKCQIGIIDQQKDASTELRQMLNCMANKSLPAAAMEISSISDNSGGRCFKTWNSQCSGANDSCTGDCCGHGQCSLHYGGKANSNTGPSTCGIGSADCRMYSYAVDLAYNTYYSQIKKAAEECAKQLWDGSLEEVYVINETNHVHVGLNGIAKYHKCFTGVN